MHLLYNTCADLKGGGFKRGGSPPSPPPPVRKDKLDLVDSDLGIADVTAAFGSFGNSCFASCNISTAVYPYQVSMWIFGLRIMA